MCEYFHHHHRMHIQKVLYPDIWSLSIVTGLCWTDSHKFNLRWGWSQFCKVNTLLLQLIQSLIAKNEITIAQVQWALGIVSRRRRLFLLYRSHSPFQFGIASVRGRKWSINFSILFFPNFITLIDFTSLNKPFCIYHIYTHIIY